MDSEEHETHGGDAPSFALRVLRAISDVRADELRPTLRLTGAVASLVFAYYLLKTVRDPLILATGGAELKAYVTGAQVVLLLPVVKLYDALAPRIGARKLVVATLALFAMSLPTFAWMAIEHIPHLGIAFCVFVGLFGLVAVAQLWSLANLTCAESVGRRVFPVVAVGGALGAVMGGYGAAALPFAPAPIMLMAAVLVMVSAVLASQIRVPTPMQASGVEGHLPESTQRETSGRSAESSVSILLEDRLLLLIGVAVILRNCVNTTGEYVLDEVVLSLAAQSVDPASYIATFKGLFYGSVNAVELLLSLFVVSRVFKRVGVRAALFALPLVSVLGSAAMLFSTGAIVVAVAKIVENSVDYSLQSTAHHALFLRTDTDGKGRVKTLTDTLLWRFGDVLAAGLIFLSTATFALPLSAVIAVNLGVALLWVWLTVALSRAHAERGQGTTAVAFG